MPQYERIGPNILDRNGITKETRIELSNQAIIYIEEGHRYSSFKLNFGNGRDGWWMGEESIGELIAELLYIQREIKMQKEVRKGDDEEMIGAPPF